MKKFLIALAAVAIVAAAPAALAAGLGASASVTATCTITTNAVSFGAYDPIVANPTGTPRNASGSVVIACTKNSIPKISITLGLWPSGSTRQLKGALGTPDYLAYELYQPPDNLDGTACTTYSGTIWGTAGANILTTVLAPSKAARTYNVCGTIAGGVDVKADTYTDTVDATVSF